MATQTWRRGALALAAGVTSAAILAPVASANGSGGGAKHRWGGVSVEATPTVVSDNLNNPRQIAIKRDTVYVAEAGTGGTSCIGTGEEQACIGFTGSVTRVGPNDQSTRIQTGLLSVNSPEGDVVGVDALTFRGNKLYGIATSSCDLAGVPPEVLAQAGKVLRLDGGTSFTAVGDASTIECTTDPDGQGPDSNPYGTVAQGKRFFIADSGGNDIVSIKNGTTTVASVLSKT
ncbi:MAG: ScyD/ScyE family protein, partial [Acidimicrobiia bacterium]